MRENVGGPYRHAAAILGFPDEPHHAEMFQASVLDWQPFADSVSALARRHCRLVAVARSLGCATCWIERRQAPKGYGATPDPKVFATPDCHFAAMDALADAADSAFTAWRTAR